MHSILGNVLIKRLLMLDNSWLVPSWPLPRPWPRGAAREGSRGGAGGSLAPGARAKAEPVPLIRWPLLAKGTKAARLGIVWIVTIIGHVFSYQISAVLLSEPQNSTLFSVPRFTSQDPCPHQKPSEFRLVFKAQKIRETVPTTKIDLEMHKKHIM